MAVQWEAFFRYIQPHVPGCPEITIEQHLQEAAAEFCGRSYVWRYAIERDFTARTLPDYQIYVPSGALLEDIHALYVEGLPISKLSASHHFESEFAGVGRPHAYSVFQDASIRFYPVPDDSYVFDGVGVLKPAPDATGVEDFIFNTHYRSIVSGALGTLLIIPNKEWTNAELSLHYQDRFARAIDDARRRDMSRGGARVAPHGFERTTPLRGF